MSALPYTASVVYRVGLQDLEAFLAEQFGHAYDLAGALAAHFGRLDAVHCVQAGVTYQAWDGPYDVDTSRVVERVGPDPAWLTAVDAWRAGGPDPSPEALLGVLACRGTVMAGEYLITI